MKTKESKSSGTKPKKNIPLAPAKKASEKPTKVVEVKLNRTKSDNNNSKPVKNAPARNAKVVAKVAITAPKAQVPKAATPSKLPTYVIAPTGTVLKPFRDAAQRNAILQKERDKKKKDTGLFLAKPNKKAKKFAVDLRIHTPASRGFFSTGGLDPAEALVRLAKVKGLNMIAVTDFYEVSFIPRVKEFAKRTSITVLPGLDLLCRVGECREISLIALFPENTEVSLLEQVLSELMVPKASRGEPNYCVDLDFAQVLGVIEGRGGLVIPSHVDKTPYRRLAIPELVDRFGFRSFDLVHQDHAEHFKKSWPSGGFNFFSFSNANALGQVGSRHAELRLASNDFAGLRGVLERIKH